MHTVWMNIMKPVKNEVQVIIQPSDIEMKNANIVYIKKMKHN